MSGDPHASVVSSRVATELRRLREAAGLSCQDVASRLGMPEHTVRRLETGTGLRIAEVEALLGLYDVTADRGAELLTVVRQCHRAWWTRTVSVPRYWRSLTHLEASANRVLDFQLYLLPVLLRTADYGRHLLDNGVVSHTADEIDQLMDAQLTRQAVLAAPAGPALHVVVDEHAMSWLGSDDPVARGQARHLLAASEWPNVTLQMIPRSVGMHAGMHGSFTIMEYDSDKSVVFTEQLVCATYYQTEPDVTVYRDIMGSLLGDALSADRTRDHLFGLAQG
ncbi:MAG TPA: helix-turn-helix transcriptional regulator [Pseudonocardiaceae bacterium]|nr:helix-turn-helix transcriptional regulator [Pseudonocardiaceae bacterium]